VLHAQGNAIHTRDDSLVPDVGVNLRPLAEEVLDPETALLVFGLEILPHGDTQRIDASCYVRRSAGAMSV